MSEYITTSQGLKELHDLRLIFIISRPGGGFVPSGQRWRILEEPAISQRLTPSRRTAPEDTVADQLIASRSEDSRQSCVSAGEVCERK